MKLRIEVQNQIVREPEPVTLSLVKDGDKIRVMGRIRKCYLPIFTFYENSKMGYRHRGNAAILGFTSNRCGQIELTEEG